jgi:hypothetical protein
MGGVGVPVDKKPRHLLRTDRADGVKGIDHRAPELSRCVHALTLHGALSRVGVTVEMVLEVFYRSEG